MGEWLPTGSLGQRMLARVYWRRISPDDALIASLMVGNMTGDLLSKFAEKVDFSKFCLSTGVITLLPAL